ncbi:subclass B1 metallo-beta-lactamase [Maricaulis sp.]|uniref:subclass B1 metallo-beta-lactamase n=1 Tax=Maricaulis sp. TaxID=1486257 RepID=UPI0025BABDF0|nr:subclass B1 metallo-beta-lactamase [Maricaulis sp.]
MKFMLLAAALVMSQAEETPRIDIEPVADGVWRHVSFQDLGGAAPTPSNGLVIETPVGLVLVDTAWGEAETRQLLAVIERQFGQRVIAAIVTHAHEDRIGGADVLAAADIPVYATPEINAAARERGLPEAAHALGEGLPPALMVAGLSWLAVEGGHARENIVVYHAPSRTLFGGCFIRPLEYRGVGYVEDGDVPAWPAALERARAAYLEAVHVVPGHGQVGGPELITHTIEQVEAALEEN